MVSSAEKRRAREAARRATKTGKIVDPGRCEVCGDEVRLDRHHPDYTKAIDVDWLCRECHAVRHAEAGDMEPAHFEAAFRGTEAVAAGYEDEAAYYDWPSWPPN